MRLKTTLLEAELKTIGEEYLIVGEYGLLQQAMYVGNDKYLLHYAPNGLTVWADEPSAVFHRAAWQEDE